MMRRLGFASHILCMHSERLQQQFFIVNIGISPKPARNLLYCVESMTLDEIILLPEIDILGPDILILCVSDIFAANVALHLIGTVLRVNCNTYM